MQRGLIMNQIDAMTEARSGFHLGPTERKYRRVEISGFVGDLADGRALLGGVVADISPGGFKMTTMKTTFTADRHTYTAVLTGGGNHYRLLAKPCWKRPGTGKYYLEIGFKILDAPWEWVELTMNEIAQ
jgi:hypothetical protein